MTDVQRDIEALKQASSDQAEQIKDLSRVLYGDQRLGTASVPAQLSSLKAEQQASETRLKAEISASETRIKADLGARVSHLETTITAIREQFRGARLAILILGALGLLSSYPALQTLAKLIP
jgi:cell division septum initiation protein DivIVA